MLTLKKYNMRRSRVAQAPQANTIYMKTLEELKKLDSKKLIEELQDVEKALFKLRFEVKNGQSKSSNQIRDNQKQVARIRTIMQSASSTQAGKTI